MPLVPSEIRISVCEFFRYSYGPLAYPPFQDLLHQAQQYETFTRSMDDTPPSAAYMASSHGGYSIRGSSNNLINSSGGQHHSRGSSRNHNKGSQGRNFGYSGGNSSSRGGGRKPYVPRCQICCGDHYADKCPQRYARSSDQSTTADLAQAFNASCNISAPTSDWYVDTGASAHMTSRSSTLDSFAPYSGNGKVIVGNGDALNITHIGTRSISPTVQLLNVLAVPHITKNILSISKLTSDFPVHVLFFDKYFCHS